ncbi:benzoate-CoA ligase family protein [Amycolatopsis minnesotensis]|uniref:Benzoate-CoA ligase family protein n=1 Tax=Amycolatopsis minnesotensis TaxID=337894 RepID=A0ABN2QMN6_9PSEU
MNLATRFVDRNVDEGRGDRVALIHDYRETTGETTGETTYAELAALVNRIGHVLRDLGVRKGDRVLLALSDGIEFVASWYAAQKIGAVTAEVYTFLKPKDYAYYLGYVAPAVVLVDEVTAGAVREAGGRNLLVVGEIELRDGERPFGTLVAEAPDRLDAEPMREDDEAIWKFTTGSTGSPKACVHPVRSPLASFENYARGVLGMSGSDRVLSVPKLFFGYARDLAALFPFGVGGTGIAFAARSTPDVLFELIARHRPTVLVNVPTMMGAMAAHPSAPDQDLSCLRLCTSAGEALPPELHRRWDAAFGVEVVDGIGSSEAYHIYLSNSPGSPAHGTLGRLVPGYSARVLDEDGNRLPDGEIGVLEVTGPTIAREYRGDPVKSAATFHGDTVRTGDLFSRDDGLFRHHGRADALLKIGGIFVAPGEIENVLTAHPEVVDCAVVGYSDGGLTRARAFVVLRDDSTTDAAELIAFAKVRLAGHKYPREIRFAEALPRTANGKLDRRALEDLP